jgi:copper(I)-binding protein
MSGLKTVLALAALLLSVAASSAADVKVGALQISAPWARATPKGAAVGGGYLKITNTGTTPDRLIGGSTAIAGGLEVHEMSMSGGTMKMRPLPNGIEIKPGETVELKPGGLHIMFMPLKQQLQQGQHFKASIGAKSVGTAGHDHMPRMSHDGMKMK